MALAVLMATHSNEPDKRTANRTHPNASILQIRTLLLELFCFTDGTLKQPTMNSVQVSAEHHELFYCLLLSTNFTRDIAAMYKYLKKIHPFLYLRTYRLLKL